jgi:iron complex outermembrane receptor protein
MSGARVRLVGLLFAWPGVVFGQIAPPSGLPAPTPLSTSAEGGKDYTQISLEELLNKDITVSATKTRIDVARAPVSVVVLTPEDIRRSGATTLGELFRTVPGLDVIESFPGHIAVSSRGTSEVFVNNMLVLVDGRRLEFQVAGVPFFENAPLRLEDVKRIEVVKGPVGALYGTNALAGIISITTFSPDEVAGTLLAVTAGERSTVATTLRQAGGLGGGWGYKLVGGYTYTDTWSSRDDGDPNPTRAIGKGDVLAQLERRWEEDDARLTLEGALTKGDLASLSINANQTREFTWPHLRVAYSRPDLRTQFTFNFQDSELRDFTGPVRLLDDARAANFSIDRTVRPFARSTVTLGGNVRWSRSEFTNIGEPRDQVVGGVFVQNEQALVPDKLTLTAALGVSDHPETDTQFDGNLALVATPVEGHSFRVSAGRAHRDPSMNENFFDFLRLVGTRQIYLAPNLDLEPESLRSLEFGYHGRVKTASGTLRLFAEGYVEEVKDLIELLSLTVPRGSIARYPTVTAVQQFQNVQDRDGKGFEAGAEWSQSSFSLLGQYAWQRFTDANTGARITKSIPTHKFSAAVRYQRNGFELDVWGHAVGRTDADDAYFLLSPRVGYHKDGWSLSVQAFNVLDERHIEGINDRGLKGESVGRAVLVSLSRSFAARSKP